MQNWSNLLFIYFQTQACIIKMTVQFPFLASAQMFIDSFKCAHTEIIETHPILKRNHIFADGCQVPPRTEKLSIGSLIRLVCQSALNSNRTPTIQVYGNNYQSIISGPFLDFVLIKVWTFSFCQHASLIPLVFLCHVSCYSIFLLLHSLVCVWTRKTLMLSPCHCTKLTWDRDWAQTCDLWVEEREEKAAPCSFTVEHVRFNQPLWRLWPDARLQKPQTLITPTGLNQTDATVRATLSFHTDTHKIHIHTWC